MNAYEAASRAFWKCKSADPAKNIQCAPQLAKLYLIQAGLHGEELEVQVEHIHRLLDEWYSRRASNDSFFPQPEDYEERPKPPVAYPIGYVIKDGQSVEEVIRESLGGDAG